MGVGIGRTNGIEIEIEMQEVPRLERQGRREGQGGQANGMPISRVSGSRLACSAKV